MGRLGTAKAAVIACIVCGPLAQNTVGAQPIADSLRVGARIRVVDRERRGTALVGTFVQWLGDTAVLVTAEGANTPFRLRPSHRVDVSVARSRHVVRNGLIGIAAGAALGAGIGAAVYEPAPPPSSDNCVPIGFGGSCFTATMSGFSRGMYAGVGAMAGAIGGGLAGGISGVARRDRWVPVSRNAKVAVLSVGAGPGVRVGIPIR